MDTDCCRETVETLPDGLNRLHRNTRCNLTQFHAEYFFGTPCKVKAQAVADNRYAGVVLMEKSLRCP